MNLLNYQDTVTFVTVTSDGYRANKDVTSQIDVPCIFLQNTGFVQGSFQENHDSDAVCYPDPGNSFILANFNRLEGMYILASMFGSSDNQSWYKIITVRVNRDHILENETDNIELILKKTSPIASVS